MALQHCMSGVKDEMQTLLQVSDGLVVIYQGVGLMSHLAYPPQLK